MRDVRARIRHIALVKIEKALPLFPPAYDFGLTEDEIRASWWNYFSWLQSPHARRRVREPPQSMEAEFEKGEYCHV